MDTPGMSKVPVRVFIRVRPLLEHEVVLSCEECVRTVGEDQLVLGGNQTFRFDRVFPSSASQVSVYECCVEPLVKACFEGYNATVFAYGQTGSGKSFTMGSELDGGSEGERGIIPRALDGIFQLLPPHTTSTVCVSYIEVYRDELRDLFVGVATEGGGVAGERGVTIREDSQGNILVLGCTSLLVSTAEEALGWLEVGNSSRVTGATHMNAKSSRSHAIFTVHIQQKWKSSEVAEGGDDPVIKSSSTLPDAELEHCLSAKFHFVDLAGSERVSKTGNQGLRFKESVHINSGLLALGNVISALGGTKKKPPHVPYRDSKITRLLKDSLGGNARTVMITCLSPAATNFAESLNSLKYAKRARNIHNRPVVNRDDQTNQLQAMQAEIQSLRDELIRAQYSGAVVTVDSSLNTEPLEVLSKVTYLEGELSAARLQCQHYQTILDSAWGRVTRLVSSDGVEQAQELLDWLEEVKTTTGGSSDPAHSPLSAKALQTIDLLRSELERCLTDLQTDEELFAEKTDEIAELQLNYEEIVSEKSRLESMWLAAQKSEEELRVELQKVLEEVRILEKELADREQIIQHQKVLLEGGVGEGVNEEGHPLDEGDVPTVEGNERMDSEFTANRSLIVGKVSTSTLEDFSEENVLKSLSTLSQILADARAPSDLGRTFTRPSHSAARSNSLPNSLPANQHSSGLPKPGNGNSNKATKSTHSEQPEDETVLTQSRASARQDNLTDTKVLKTARSKQPGKYANPGSQKNVKSLDQNITKMRAISDDRTSTSKRRHRVEVCSFDSEDVRPTTPVGVSNVEPCFSRVGRTVSAPCEAGDGARSVTSVSVTEMEALNESAVESRRQLTTAEEKLTLAHDELRNLNLKIRLKEELIHELVKTGRSTKQLNTSYLTKIQTLEKDVLSVTRELGKTQDIVGRGSQPGATPDLKKALDAQKKKLALTENKLASLQKKQKETQRLVQFGTRRERRVDDLEGEVERLRNQQEQLKRRLKTKADKKTRLENDLQKYQHRIRVLQVHSDQQSKVLRVKTEEAAVARRKLRRMSAKTTHSEPVTESSEGVWLDQEVARILEQKQAIHAIERELSERERVVREKETLIAERDALTFKQLQASQTTARDIIRLSLQIDSIGSSLKKKESIRPSSEVPAKPEPREVEALRKEKDELVVKCSELQQKMENNNFLPEKDQRNLCELNEHIEILEAALDYKSRSIDFKQPGLRVALESEASYEQSLRGKLEQLTAHNLQDLLLRYIDKVVGLQLSQSASTQTVRELEVRSSEQDREAGRLQRTLKQTTAASERQLLTLQKDHEQQVQLLVEQLADQQQHTSQDTSLRDKVKQLEKDLYYYKKTSRDLRKKLKSGNTDFAQSPSVSMDSIARIVEYSEVSMVQDSLSSDKTGVLLSRNVTDLKTEEGSRVSSDGSDHDSGRSGSETNSKVVKKSRRQLRQLSTGEIAQRKSRKDKTNAL